MSSPRRLPPVKGWHFAAYSLLVVAGLVALSIALRPPLDGSELFPPITMTVLGMVLLTVSLVRYQRERQRR